MQRMIGVAAGVLIVSLSCVTNSVVAGIANDAIASSAAPDPVPAYLKPVPMDIQEASPKRSLTIDIPANGTIYPPEIIPPQFAWRDENPTATVWQVEVVFGEKARSIKVWSNGEKMQIGPVDDALVGYVPPTLTPEQAAAHTWRPDPKTWEEIKKHSVNQPATVIVSGYASQKDREPVSRSQAVITTSKDPVGAPIFYRDVPLIPPPPETEQRGVIKPLPDSVLPKIKWELRYINQPQSKVMMTNLAHMRKLPLLFARRQDHGNRCRRPSERQGTLRARSRKESQHHKQRIPDSLERILRGTCTEAFRIHEPDLARRKVCGEFH